MSPVHQLPAGEFRRVLVAAAGLIVVAAVLLAGLAMPAVGAVGMITRVGTTAFNDLPDEFQPIPPSEQSVLLAADGTEITRFYAENRRVVPLEKISPWVQKAAVAIEDHRFYRHHGVDLEGMGRALLNNLAGRDTQGASTLTQQYVKNTLIEMGLQSGDEEAIRQARARSYTRKLREAKYAASIERHYTKDQILAGYLNVAPFGPSVYGVEAASLHYFSKPAKDLNIAEGALLAGIVQSPAKHDPLRFPKNAKNRRDTVLGAMYNQGVITTKEYQQAKAIQIKDMLKPSKQPQGCAAAGAAAYFCSYVVDEILNNKVFGKTLSDRRRLLLRGGLKIRTTLHADAMAKAQEALEEQVPKNDPSNVKAATASIEPGTGKITVLAQNTTFGRPSDQDRTATETSYAVDRRHGGGAGFPTGSSFKPMTLAVWLKNGKSAYALVGGRTKIPLKDFHSTCPEVATGGPGVWEVHNAIPHSEAPSSVIDGTQRSLNTHFASMATMMDLCDVLRMSQTVGAVAGDGTKPDPKKKYYFYPTDIIGTQPVPPLAMANAYATWAADGTYCTPIAIESVTDNRGRQLKIPEAKCHQVLEPEVAKKVMRVLNLTYNNYGGKAYIGRPAATKTGTTDYSSNAWMVGTTPTLATAVWVGHSEGIQPMHQITIGGRYYPQVWGSTIPARIWRDYMRFATQPYPVAGFPAVDLGGTGTNIKPVQKTPRETPGNQRDQQNGNSNQQQQESDGQEQQQ